MEKPSQNANKMNNNDERYLNDYCNGRGDNGRKV
jgi:hypothetical protein